VLPSSFVAVDWSGALRGERRKIWLAEAREGRLVRLEDGRTREQVIGELVASAARERSLVAGLDFAFSFPLWFLREHGAASAPAMWAVALERGERWLGDCAPPFWGRSERRLPRDPRARWRRTESEHPARIQPKSVFQIGGAGSVGTGSVRGMPHLARLRSAGFAIWPFDEPRLPLAIEIYPRFLTGPVNKRRRAARELYLQNHCGREDPALLSLAASSEDAFDAAVSALVMSRHAPSFARLHVLDELDYRMEGRIWRPPEVERTFLPTSAADDSTLGSRSAQAT